MDFAAMNKIARERFAGSCRVCPVCNGVACSGEIPGMGGVGTGASFHNNFRALAGYRLNLRVVHDVAEPVLATTILGMDLAAPIIGAAIGGIALNMKGALSEHAYAQAIVSGCKGAGIIGMTGDGASPEVFQAGIAALQTEGGWGIPVIKPRQTERIIELAQAAAAAGAPAFAVDIDAAALVNMTRTGQPVGPKTTEELARIKQNTTIPFIVKGIMTSDEAEACVDAGVDGIVVSNHGGRALDHTPGTAEVLPAIVDSVRGQIAILVDGGIRSGVDILKMLALGADGVLVGRPFAIGAVGGEAAGVGLVADKLIGELRAAMILTGTAAVNDVQDDVLW